MNEKTQSQTTTSRASAGDTAASARRELILQEAAKLFSAQGFDATTVRDIAKAAGILAGSIYHHFESKEDIFLAVHSRGMAAITDAVEAAVAGHDDPWRQLEAAAVAHCDALLSAGDLQVVVSPFYSDVLSSLRGELVAQRDRYDTVIAGIVDRLDLPPDIDRKIFRLHFLGALNWIPTWYQEEGPAAAEEIGRQLVLMLRPR